MARNGRFQEGFRIPSGGYCICHNLQAGNGFPSDGGWSAKPEGRGEVRRTVPEGGVFRISL
jgi:hypothetical protein